MLTEDSSKAFLIIESVDPKREGDLEGAVDDLADLVTRYLGAEVYAKKVITKDNREMVIDD